MWQRVMRQGFVRIIGGQWRGRRLQVPAIPHLRPTPDRVRETLFNWLAPVIAGAHCLDLFSGTGALGFEALSRGARAVVMTDQSAEVIKALQAEALRLKAEQATIYRANAPYQLQPTTQPFDIVFLDPPYDNTLLLPSCFYLEDHGFLAATAYIYLEARQVIKDNELPRNWRLIKSQQAGQVAYHLAQRTVQNEGKEEAVSE